MGKVLSAMPVRVWMQDIDSEFVLRIFTSRSNSGGLGLYHDRTLAGIRKHLEILRGKKYDKRSSTKTRLHHSTFSGYIRTSSHGRPVLEAWHMYHICTCRQVIIHFMPKLTDDRERQAVGLISFRTQIE